MFVCLFVTESHVTHAGLILTHVGKADPSALAVLRMTGMHYHTVPGNQTQAFRNAGQALYHRATPQVPRIGVVKVCCLACSARTNARPYTCRTSAPPSATLAASTDFKEKRCHYCVSECTQWNNLHYKEAQWVSTECSSLKTQVRFLEPTQLPTACNFSSWGSDSLFCSAPLQAPGMRVVYRHTCMPTKHPYTQKLNFNLILKKILKNSLYPLSPWKRIIHYFHIIKCKVNSHQYF